MPSLNPCMAGSDFLRCRSACKTSHCKRHKGVLVTRCLTADCQVHKRCLAESNDPAASRGPLQS